MPRTTLTRIGGHLVAESLEALGAQVVMGLPGIHALPVWEALRTSPIRDAAFRTELAAGFAAAIPAGLTVQWLTGSTMLLNAVIVAVGMSVSHWTYARVARPGSRPIDDESWPLQ